ncbi:TM0106 family RecB-like putative nuclease [Advenella sp. RU8]|uniref:TM0106 family RecB-like putative nuclease n=1 Tax=Advenella sp. RU8 TaxID=3399575 RepID=UPI003AABD8AB
MYQSNGKLIYSPSDLTTYMSSPFASWMNRWALVCPEEAPQPDEEDALNTMFADKGLAHEAALLTHFQQQGLSIVDIAQDNTGAHNNIARKLQATQTAMQNGVDVIYQAVLQRDPFIGYADFLMKVPGQSRLGNYHYEVWDTKLASVVKPSFVVQLCCYADMLESLQGRRPEHIVVALGNQERERLKTDDYYYYYLALKSRFLAEQEAFNPNAMPDPADSKSHGRWSGFAERLLQDNDHLSLVANITRSQIKKLKRAGISTCQQLAQASIARVPGLSAEVLARLQAQAKIQKASDGAERPLFEVLQPEDAQNPAGLMLLPPHSDLDVFFDIEGFPLDEGGLEYLWGCTYFDENGQRQFKDFWAHNREQEKQAFEGFITWVYGRWQQDPHMHIYHYANYEIASCRKLMGRYGVYEHEVDQLLRNDVFVDLYKIVKGGLRVGEPRYSIKNIEHLYRGKRDTAVGSGGDSVVVYEQWRNLNRLGQEGDTWQSSAILKDIRDYNIDDCNSTQELTVWLRNQQENHGIVYDGQLELIEPDVKEEVTQRIQLRDRLLARAKTEPEAQARITENLAWILEFHRRESKPVFWRLFDRLGLSHDELEDDIDCLANCQRTGREPFKPAERARNLAYEYHFNVNQEFKIPRSDSMYLLGNERRKVKILPDDSDFKNGRVVVQAGFDPGEVISLIPDEFVNPSVIQKAIDEVVGCYEKGELADSAILGFLRRDMPNIKGHRKGEPIVTDITPAGRMAQIIQAVCQLDSSYLTLQGPPGAGKTYTGKHIIAELLKQGKRIGIGSNSHKAINNLLVGVAGYCRSEGIEARYFCTKNTGDEIENNGIEVIKNDGISAHLQAPACVVGTTAWGFCRDDLAGRFDYLFIDEAGQVSVANLVGMSRAAQNIILMGDQMQLGQPSQGSHPEDSGLSILDYLLHDSPIIPPGMGVFLDTTFRMHSAVNDYISHAIYEGQLKADVANDRQRVMVPDNDDGSLMPPLTRLSLEAGLVFVPMAHEGNTQASEEEVEVITQLGHACLQRRFRAKDGSEQQMGWEDILFVAPYNHQVNKLQQALGPAARVGSVDKFQGQEAPVVFFSLCTSDATESPRGIDFLFDIHRINVAISRAQALAVVVGNASLLSTEVTDIAQMSQVNVLSRLDSYARPESDLSHTSMPCLP